MKICIIGFGFIAEKGHVPYYLSAENVEVAGIADICPQRLDVARTYFSDTKLFNTAQEMLTELRDMADLVDICTPPNVHYEYSQMALSLGYHVICEKPLSLNSQEIESLINLAHQHKKAIFPSHNYLFSPAFSVVNENINMIGDPYVAYYHIYRKSHARGVAEWNADWRVIRDISLGGILADHGPHSIYLILSLLRVKKIKGVSCLLFSSSGIEPLEDTISFIIEFDNHKKASIFLTWRATYRSTNLAIMGTSGFVNIENDLISYFHPTQGTIEDHTLADSNNATHVKWFEKMLSTYIESIEVKNFVLFQQYILHSLCISRIIDACYLSASKNGDFVPLDISTILE